MSERAAVQTLAKQDVLQLRLSGMILAVLVGKGVLTNQEVRGIIQDVVMHVPEGLDGYREALTALHDEF